MSKKWYVLYVNAGQEYAVAKQLQQKGFNTVVPTQSKLIRTKGQWKDQESILFDGYVFIQMNYTAKQYYAIKRIQNVIKLLGGGKNPIPLSDAEAELILALSDILAVPSVLFFTGSGAYKPISGFLSDYRNNIIKVQRHYKKATVQITIAGEPVKLTVSFVEQTSEGLTD